MKRFVSVMGVCLLFGGLDLGAGGWSETAAQPPQKLAPQKDKQPPKTGKTLPELLDEPVPLKVDQATLRDVLTYLQERVAVQGHDLLILVNVKAFKELDAADIHNAAVQLPDGKKLPLGLVLQLVLEQLPVQATYLVRPGHLEILPAQAAAPEAQKVRAKFVNTPLEEALRELSQQTGIGIVLDGRLRETQKFVTASFPPDTNLVTAVGLLADGAGLKLRIVDRVLYVTSPLNEAEIVPARLGMGGM